MKTERLSCKLTDTEIRERGEKLADLRKQIAEIEAAKKSAAENFKSTIISLVNDADDLTDEINTKSELRDVEITEEKNYEKKQAYTIRLDTGETFRTRALTPQEMQRPFFADFNAAGMKKDDAKPKRPGKQKAQSF